MALEPPADDYELVDRARVGDMAALSCLMLRHHDALARVIGAAFPDELNSVADPEDVLQVTLSEIADRIAEFVPESVESVGAWFRTIAKRNLTDLIRFHRAAKRGGAMRLVVGGDAATTPLWMHLVDEQSLTPSRVVSHDEVVAAMELAMEQLPHEYHEVIRLRYLEEVPLEEVAVKLQRSEDAIRGISFRAIQKLRKIMGRYSRYFSST